MSILNGGNRAILWLASLVSECGFVIVRSGLGDSFEYGNRFTESLIGMALNQYIHGYHSRLEREYVYDAVKSSVIQNNMM